MNRASAAQTVLVTGAAGRLGRTVLEHLRSTGREVIGVDRLADDGVYALDLADRDAVHAFVAEHRPHALIHLAAIAVPFSAPEHVILETNVRLAQNAIDAALAAGTRRIIAASSPTVIGYGRDGWLPDALPITERSPRRPWNSYALSKVAVEELVAMHARADPDTLFASFRPCFVIAPEEWAGAPTQQGHTIVDRLTDPSLAAVSLFNYVDARDVAEFLAAWLDAAAPTNGSCYFVSAEDAMVLRPVPQAIRAFYPGAAPMTSALDAEQSVFSSARATAELGWRARRSWRTELPEIVLNDLLFRESETA